MFVKSVERSWGGCRQEPAQTYILIHWWTPSRIWLSVRQVWRMDSRHIETSRNVQGGLLDHTHTRTEDSDLIALFNLKYNNDPPILCSPPISCSPPILCSSSNVEKSSILDYSSNLKSSSIALRSPPPLPPRSTA